MKNWFKNWRTTLAGVTAITGVVGPVLANPHSTAVDYARLVTDTQNLALITIGVGLIMSKDASNNDKPVPVTTKKGN